MKVKLILLSIVVLVYLSFIHTVRIQQLIKSKPFNSKKLIKSDIKTIIDLGMKIPCDCTDIASDDWNSRVCTLSCNDYCHETEEVLSVCIQRCDNKQCSQVGEVCDITEETGPGMCPTANYINI